MAAISLGGRCGCIKFNPYVFCCALELPLGALWPVDGERVLVSPTDIVLRVLSETWVIWCVGGHDDHLEETHASRPVAKLSKLLVTSSDELLVCALRVTALKLNRNETAVR